MVSLFVALALSAIADPTPAQGGSATSPPAVVAPGKKARDPNERVCWEEQPTGSHLPKEVCATRAEREAMERQARDSLGRNDRSHGGLRPQ